MSSEDSLSNAPPVCDYEGSDYRERFWRGQSRIYEDQVERVALRRLMPSSGQTLIEIGAGFGRLAAEYKDYDKVVLFDYSRSLLREAQMNLGNDPRFIYVAGNWYQMPFVDGLFATMVQIRTLHHAADVPKLLNQLARIARPGGRYVLEFANKKNLKAILRYLLGRQNWSPFTLEPVEFVELNFDFHPRWIQQQLQLRGFRPGRMLAVSYFRIPLLKKIVPNRFLVALDSLLQVTGTLWQYSPSVFVQVDHPTKGAAAAFDAFFACPTCETPLPQTSPTELQCTNQSCTHRWRVDGNFYDFKESL